MRTAIDTNILSALWSGEVSAMAISRQLIEAKSHGALLIAPIVYAELLAYPKATEAFVNGFIADTGITVQFQLEEPVWLDAGRRFARYVERRRSQDDDRRRQVGPKAGLVESKRLLADFVVGSHALLQADRLMSLDASRYRAYFPELKLV